MGKAATTRLRRLYWPLVALCTAGVALRVLVMLTYSSAVFVFYNGDSIRYARIAAPGYHSGLFSDPFAPAGYPAFLKLLRAIWSALPFTVGVQHALGLAIALLLYALARRLGSPRGVALVPAAVVLLSGDQLFLEHSLLSETLWAALVTGGLYAVIRGAGTAEPDRNGDRDSNGDRDGNADRDGDPRWLIAAGLLLAGSALARQISIPLLLVASVWVAFAVRGRVARRAVLTAATLGPAVVLLGLYSGVAHLEHGVTGLGGRSGWQLYGRVAQFANCADFHPPGRTRLLCQSTPSAKRPGLVAQLYDPSLPLGRFDYQGKDDGLLRQFALDAIVNQPGDYLGAVLADWATAAGWQRIRPGEGATPSLMRFSRLSPYGAPAPTVQGVAAYYRRAYTSVRALPLPHWAQRLGRYQSILRLHEVLVFPLLLIVLAGLLLSRGPTRAGLALVLGFSLALYLLPPVANAWDVRYGVLPGELLAAAAAASGWRVAVALRERLERRTGLVAGETS